MRKIQRFRKIAIFGLLAMLSAGCMLQTQPNGITKWVPAPQVGANVQVLDLCGYKTPAMLYSSHGYAVRGLEVVPGQEFWVALPTRDGVNTRSVSLTYVARLGDRIIGSVSESFSVYYRRGSQHFQWVISRDGRGGGRGVRTSRCPSTAR